MNGHSLNSIMDGGEPLHSIRTTILSLIVEENMNAAMSEKRCRV